MRRHTDRAPEAKRDMLCGILGHWWRAAMFKAPASSIHPGREKVATWGNCSVRHAKSYLRELEALNILVAVGDKRGGRGLATEYRLDVDQLVRWIERTFPTVSRKLVSKLTSCERTARNRRDLSYFAIIEKGRTDDE